MLDPNLRPSPWSAESRNPDQQNPETPHEEKHRGSSQYVTIEELLPVNRHVPLVLTKVVCDSRKNLQRGCVPDVFYQINCINSFVSISFRLVFRHFQLLENGALHIKGKNSMLEHLNSELEQPRRPDTKKGLKIKCSSIWTQNWSGPTYKKFEWTQATKEKHLALLDFGVHQTVLSQRNIWQVSCRHNVNEEDGNNHQYRNGTRQCTVLAHSFCVSITTDD